MFIVMTPPDTVGLPQRSKNMLLKGFTFRTTDAGRQAVRPLWGVAAPACQHGVDLEWISCVLTAGTVTGGFESSRGVSRVAHEEGSAGGHVVFLRILTCASLVAFL